MAAPPFDPGAVQATARAPVVEVAMAVTAVGPSGVVAGTAGADATEAVPVPTPLEAVTVNVYEVPLVNPDTVQALVPVEQVKPPGVEVAV